MSTAVMQAPGCYGLAVCHSVTSKLCRACPFVRQCKEESIKKLERLSAQMDVQDYIFALQRDGELGSGRSLRLVGKPGVERRTSQRKRKLTPEQEDAVEQITQRYSKAGRLLKTMYKNGVNLHAALTQGVNPFAEIESHVYMRTACAMLLDGGFTRAELRNRLIEEHGWGYATANSHVVVVVHTMTALSATAEERGRFTVWDYR